MPQIGWYEILIIVVLAILIIGPKDFPIIIKKVGSWVGTFKNYFSDFQKDITDMESDIEHDISTGKKFINKKDNKEKNE